MAGFSRIALQLLLLCALILASASCGLRLDNDQLFSRASVAMEESNLRAAIIDLKAILQREPGFAEARLMLGKAYLRVADPLSAEKELRKSLELGISRERVVVPLCESLLAQRAFDRVLEEAVAENATTGIVAVKLHLIRGDAELALGRSIKAREQYVAALESDPDNGIAYLGMASVAIIENRHDQAAQFLDRALEVAPDLPLVWLARGEFSMGRRDPAAAQHGFERALELAVDQADLRIRINALTGMTDVHLINGDLDSARKSVLELKAIAPDAIMTRYSDARVAFARGDLDAAVQLLQGILKDLPEFRKAHFLYGVVSRAKGNLLQSEMYLASVVASWPANEEARRLLADVRLRQQKFVGAIEVLEPLLQGDNADDQLLAAAGIVKFRAGQNEEGLRLFERSVEADPDNLERKMDLVALYLAGGQIDDAVTLLESLERVGVDGDRLSLLKVVAIAKNGDLPGAIRKAEELLAQSPDNVLLLVFAGRLHNRAGDVSAATAAFEQANSLDPNNVAVLLSLGRIESASGKLSKARSHYERSLQLEPDNPDVMMEISELAMAGGDVATAVSWLEKARDSSSTAVSPRVRLVVHYLSQNRLDEAKLVAEEAVLANDKDARALNILGVSLMARGDFAAASRSFADAVRYRPDVPAYQLNQVRAELQRGNDDAAWKMMRQIHDAYPEHIATAMQLAAFHLHHRRYPEALEIANRLQVRLPDRAAGLVLTAEVLAAQLKFSEAAAYYDQAMKKEMTRKLAVRAFQLRKRASSSEPYEPIVNYLKQNGRDTVARMLLAEAMLANGESEGAVAQYDKVLALDSYNLVALNNMAWILAEKGDSRAEEFAKIAYDILPDNGAIADTYGYILLKLGQSERATEILRAAVEADPQNEEIRSHLAEALEQAQEEQDL